jgi:hypothetical protein
MPWDFRPTIPPLVRGCLNKEPLAEWQAALKARRVEKQTGRPTSFYRCPHCNHFHIATDRHRSRRER